MAELICNGIRTHYQRLGQGNGKGRETVVFVHGLVMDNLSSWYFTAACQLARDADVLLYDLRGHGRSEQPSRGYTVGTLVADLVALLDGIQIEGPISLVGNSFGGLLALVFAAEYPERVRRLALVDALLPGAGWAEQMTATLGLQGSERDSRIAASFQSWLGRHSKRKATRLARHAESLVHGTSLVEDLLQSGCWGDSALAGITCPTLALFGEESDVLAGGRRLARVLPACTLRILTGCSHSVLWEKTDEVCAQIRSFIVPPSGKEEAA